MAKKERIGLEATVDDRNFQRGMKRYNQGVAKMESGTTRAANSINSALTTMAGALGLYLGAQTMIQFGKAAHEAATQVEQLTVANEQLASQIGTTSDELVQAMQAASQGTIGIQDALQASNKAMLFGIIESKEEMAELTQIAITLGSAMGQNAAKSLDDLTVALGRNSPMILDNLGISLKLSDAYLLYADSIGKSVEALTEEEKAMGFRKAALIEGRKKMGELGGVTETAAIKQERFNRAWKDFLLAAGQAGDQMASGAEATGSMTELLDKAADAILNIADTFDKRGMPAVYAFRKEVIQNSETLEEYNLNLARSGNELAELDWLLGLTEGSFAALKKAEDAAVLAGFDDAKMLREMSRAQEWAIAGTRELTEATRRQEWALMDITNAQRLSLSIADVRAESLELEEQATKDAKTATDELTRAIEAQMQAYRDIQIEQTNYILGLKQSALDAEAAEANYYQNRAGIAEQSNDAVADADEKLKDELASAEEDWNTIRTQLLGDWDAKGQEQTEKDLAWHQDIYENRIGAAHVAHAAELKEAEAAKTEETGVLAAAYAQQQADQKAADEASFLLSALRTMKAAGEFEKYEQLADKSAEEAARGFEAGTITMTNAIQIDVARAMQGLETTAEGVGDVVEGNEEKTTALFDNLARTALLAGGKTSDVFLGIGTGTTTMADTAETSFAKTQTEWDKLITGLQTTVTEVKWKELGIEPGESTVEGIIKGVDNKTAALEAAMKRLAEAAKAAYEDAIDSGSEAKEFIPLGVSMIDGIILGMKREHQELEAEAVAIVDSVIMDMLEEAKKIREVGPSMAKDLRIIFKEVLAGLVFETRETVEEAARRVFDEIVATAEGRWPEVTGKLGHLFNVVLEDLGDEAERVILTIAEQMSDLLSAASIFGRVGASAAAMLRTREITPAEERIRAMEDQLALLEDQGIELERQAELVAEIAVERAKVAEIESDIAALEQQRQTLRMLEDQMALLDMIAQYGLDAQEVLGGITLGRGADPAELLRAMTGAYEQIIEQVQAQAFEPLGYRYTPPASPGVTEARGGAITTIGPGAIQIGPNYVSNEVGMQNFEDRVEQVLVNRIQNG